MASFFGKVSRYS